MHKTFLSLLFVLVGLAVLPACAKKKKVEQTEQQEGPCKKERSVEVGKELVEWCENSKWCGCPKE